MAGYGRFCPVAKGAEVFAERWMPLVLRELLCGSTRFNDLHRGVPLMSRSLLSRKLRRLEEVGVVDRKLAPSGPEYRLTEAGREFAPIVQSLGAWGQRWFRSDFSRDELDVGVLLWDMRRGVKPDAFPARRISVEFDFPDQPAGKRRWWLICADGETEICPTDPGFEVDLYVISDVETMTRVWMGDLAVSAALKSGKIELSGERELRDRFEGWLGLRAFAHVKDERARLGRAAEGVHAAQRPGAQRSRPRPATPEKGPNPKTLP
ncbi:MAG: helix-turn-helix transcriptional regulator [Hyphomicrobiales bacterium]|nr:helix-turn-helix transcriptional regulator [Hyphomicrobiales bacterium]